METDTTTEDVGVTHEENAGEVVEQADTISVSRKEYHTLNQTLGSLKKELKGYKKASEDSKESPSKESKTDNALLQKSFLRAAGISNAEDVELALSTAKKWGVDVDVLVDDDDFKVKLERQQTARQNAIATSNVKGGQSQSNAKSDASYWIAKGAPPTPTDVPDRKTRTKIVRAMMDSGKSSGKFYNE